MSSEKRQVQLTVVDGDGHIVRPTPVEELLALRRMIDHTVSRVLSDEVPEEHRGAMVEALAKTFAPFHRLVEAVPGAGPARMHGGRFKLQTPIRGDNGEIVHMVIEEYETFAALKARESELGITWELDGKKLS